MNCPLMVLRGSATTLRAVEKKTDKAVGLTGNEYIRINNHSTALALAMEGLGAVMVMQNTAREPLAAKQLMRVLPGYHFGHLNIELKLRDSLPSPPARAFLQFMQLQYAGNAAS